MLLLNPLLLERLDETPQCAVLYTVHSEVSSNRSWEMISSSLTFIIAFIIIWGFSYCIRHGYEYDDGDMRTTRRAMLLFHKIFKNRNNYLLTGVTHEGISTDTTSSMGEHQPFQT